MKFKADIFVTLKRTVNDPQGLTIKMGLADLGFDRVTDLRAGKYIEIWLDAPDQATAERQADATCDKLLANPVIEDYRYTVHPAEEAKPGGT